MKRNAEFWDASRARSSLPERKYLDWLVAERPPASRILDVGCGTGRPIAEYLRSRDVAITGCDAAPAMIRKARERLPSDEWLVADMRTLALERRFGGLVAWDSFFHLTADEQRSTLPRFREHLLPGGVLLFTSGPDAGQAIGELNGEPLFHASLSPGEYREILGALGFEEIRFDAEDPACGGHSVWRARLA